MSKTTRDRLERSRSIDAETGCWNWTGSKRRGYGRLTIGSRADGTRHKISAHRYSYEAFVGPIPDGLFVCHRCDNRACVNPDHLFVGTNQDNVDDRVSKGRGPSLRGVDNPRAKLTEADVIEARRLKDTGLSFEKLARRFNVAKKTIWKAVRGDHWSHVIGSPE